MGREAGGGGKGVSSTSCLWGWDHQVLHGQVQGGLWVSQGCSAPTQALPLMGTRCIQGLEGGQGRSCRSERKSCQG